MRVMTRTLIVGLVLVVACGRSGGDTSRDTLTQRQHDSILAKSSIPGASAVGRALKAADSTNARMRETDSVRP
jgi:hypothetical protein